MADRTDDTGTSCEYLYYGWYIVGAMFFTTVLMAGFRNGFGVFVKTWEEDFGASVGLISFAAGASWTVNGLVQPTSGRLTDAYGAGGGGDLQRDRSGPRHRDRRSFGNRLWLRI